MLVCRNYSGNFLEITRSGNCISYESFFDPVIKTDYLANKLSNATRDKEKKTCNKENNRNVPNITEDENENLTQAEINAFFFSKVPQKIKNHKLFLNKDIFQYRTKFLNINFFDTFPKFSNIPEMVGINIQELF